jgi:hypothetical protein
LLLLASTQTFAQQSIGLSGVYNKFLGNEYKFPYGNVGDFNGLFGAKASGIFGINFKTAFTASFTYAMNKEKGYTYTDRTFAKATMMDLELLFRYYLAGAINRRGGMYLFIGPNIGMTDIKWRKADHMNPTLDEGMFFKDTNIMYGNIGTGVGVEAWIGFAYLFGEGRITYNLQHYVNNTTIKEMHLRHFWGTSAGLRIPFGMKP